MKFRKSKSKKSAILTGVLMAPLCIGCRAVIRQDRGYIYTSKVVAIHSVQPGNIIFETENTHYHLLMDPWSQTADCRLALGAAA